MSEQLGRVDTVTTEFQSQMHRAARQNDAILPYVGEVTGEALQELNALRSETNTRLQRMGLIGADMAIHLEAFEFTKQGDTWASVNTGHPVVGRYEGVVAMSGVGRLAHIIDRYLYDDEVNPDGYGRYSYAFIDNEAVEIFRAPSTELPKEIWPNIKYFETAIDRAGIQGFDKIWQEIRGLTHNQPSYAVKNWFFERLEQKTGLVDKAVICDSDRQYTVKLEAKNGIVNLLTNTKPHVEGFFVGFTAVPSAEIREVNGIMTGFVLDNRSDAELGFGIDDGTQVVKIPTRTCTSLIDVESLAS